MSRYQIAALFETETELTAFSSNIWWAKNAEVQLDFIKVVFQKLSLAHLLLTEFWEGQWEGSNAKCASLLVPHQLVFNG